MFKSYLSGIVAPQETWYIAIRKNQGQCLFEGNGKNFRLIKNPLRYWCADPFLFSYNNKDYLFAELFDKKIRRGIIGVAEIKRNRVGKFHTCLKLDNHLSYPCVYEKDGCIYMVPENYQSGYITIYKATDFPYKWEKYKTIAKIPGVDTTPFLLDEKEVFFTTIEREGDGHNANLYSITDGNINALFDNDKTVRCAGNFIKTQNALIRPSQDDYLVYGNRLKINKVISIDPVNYKEETMFFVQAPGKKVEENEIAITLTKKSSKNFYGCHTYNCNEKYEIIDLVTDEVGLYDVYRYYKNRIKKIIRTVYQCKERKK